MNKKQKNVLARIIVSAFLTMALMIYKPEGALALLYLIPYFLIGYDILIKAFHGVLSKEPFDENFLMAIATLGAMVLGKYGEGVAVMLFYQTGELFQSIAVGKSRKNIGALMDLRPDWANIEENGVLKKVDPKSVPKGSIVTVLPGEKIPIDGVVYEGSSFLNSIALTGESAPSEVFPGDEVKSGCINETGALKIKTTAVFGEDTASKILRLVREAGSRKSKSEKFISKFSRYYTPTVCAAALILALLPPVFNIISGNAADFSSWVYRALTFLVISCPCALVISIPLTFFAGIGGAGKKGILIKGSNYMETLSKVRHVVFDKTGTLTKGVFEVQALHHNKMEEEKILNYAAKAESFSTHPISKSIIKAYGKAPDLSDVSEVKELSGKGVTAKIGSDTVAVGNSKLMESLNIPYVDCHLPGTVIHIAVNGSYEGHILISDEPKKDAAKAVSKLYSLGIKTVTMLTGDSEKAALAAAKELRITSYHASLLPGDKVAEVEKIIKAQEKNEKTAFCGDGINDAPVLSLADVGISMGAIGSDAAIEASDVVLMDDNPIKVCEAIEISKKCIGIVYENIIFAIGIKLLFLILGALGKADMWFAVFADVGVMVIAVLNAIRALSTPKGVSK